MDLHGRRALVSGAGSSNGIGFAIASALAAAGAQVAITGASERIHQRGKELGAPAFSADLTDSAAVTRLVADVVDQLSGLEILVNNAGMTSINDPARGGRLDELDDQAWSNVIERNLTSTVYLTRACLPWLRASGSGRVIAISSTTGPVQAMAGEIGYATAKAGMTGFVRALALDEARHGLTANAIAPGWIATESQSAHEEAQGRRTPLGRSGRPEEIAAAAVWLASPRAGFITGQVIVIDGGNSIAEERAL